MAFHEYRRPRASEIAQQAVVASWRELPLEQLAALHDLLARSDLEPRR